MFEEPDIWGEKKSFKMEDAYMDGFRSGLFWPDQWETHGQPGGPAIFNKEDAKKNAAWRAGWAYGHHCKLTGKKVLEDPYPHMRNK